MVNYKQLLAFVTVVDEGGFTPAAKKLFITQPAISWQIKSIEKSMDVLLIERSEREILLTEAGKILYHNAKIIMDQYHALNEDMEHYKNNENGNVRVAASTIPGEYLLPKLIKAFRQLHANVQTKVYISDSTEVIDKVLQGTVSFGITGFMPENPELEANPFVQDRLKLVCALDYPIHKVNTISSVLKEPIVMREEGSGTRATTLAFLKQNGGHIDEMHTNMVFGSAQSSLSAVEAGLGIGWLSEAAIADAIKLNHVRLLNEAFDIPRQLYIVHYKNRTLSPSALALKNYLMHNGADMKG